MTSTLKLSKSFKAVEYDQFELTGICGHLLNVTLVRSFVALPQSTYILSLCFMLVSYFQLATTQMVWPHRNIGLVQQTHTNTRTNECFDIGPLISVTVTQWFDYFT